MFNQRVKKKQKKSSGKSASTQSTTPHVVTGNQTDRILSLQRTIGNQATMKMLNAESGDPNTQNQPIMTWLW